MRRFHLKRAEDLSGVSGVGIVAEGVEFHDGQCALSWFGQYHTVTISPNMATIEGIHGHHGLTVVEWEDLLPTHPREVK
mgnify:CR=1 FL=1